MSLEIKFKTKEKIIEECMVPTPGDCWIPTLLFYKNCDGCKYWEGCTHIKKGKWNNKNKG